MAGVGNFLEALAQTAAKHTNKLFIGAGIAGGFKYGEDLIKPYKYGSARVLTSALTAIREADDHTLREGWDIGWQQSEHVSPGQAAVGAVGSFIPGIQKTDKLDWTNANEVDLYFKRDSTTAKYVSGTLDFASNVFLDPLVIGGKIIKGIKLASTGMRGVSKKGFLVRGDNMDKLVSEVDSAVNGARNAAAKVIDSIIKHKDDIGTLESLPIVARSTNPTAVARVFSAAANTGSVETLGTILKAGLGHADSIDELRALQPQLSESISELNSRLYNAEDSIKNQMAKINRSLKPLEDRPSLTSAELKRKEKFEQNILDLKAERNSLIEEKKVLKSRYDLYNRTTGGEESIAGMVGRELAWSRSRFIESLRNLGAEVQGRGWYVDISPEDDPLLYKAMSKSLGIGNRALRMVGYFTPSYKAREVPAGAVTITGDAGRSALNEFRARLIQGARNAKLTAEEQRAYYTAFARLGTDSARLQFLDNFENGVTRKMFARRFSVSDLNPKQLAVIDAAIVKVVDDLQEAKLNVMKKIINDDDYVHIDSKSGQPLLFGELLVKVNELAQRIAGEGNKVTQKHISDAKNVISRNPAYRTQVPNVHYGVDFDKLNEVLRDENSLFLHILAMVRREPGLTPKDMVKLLDNAKSISSEAKVGVGASAKELATKTYDRLVVDSYENFQNLVWKPSVLLSLRYTSRNMLDAWTREIGSFVDMSTHYGYPITTAIKGTVVLPLLDFTPTKSGIRRLIATAKRIPAKSQLEVNTKRRMENEVDVARTFRLHEKDYEGNTIVSNIRDRYHEEGEHFLESSKDVLTASIEGLNQAFFFFKGYRGSKIVQPIAQQIHKIGNDIWNLKDPDKYSLQLAEALRMGDYESAYQIARSSQPEKIYSTLEEMTSRALKASGDIKAIVKKTKIDGNPIISGKLDELNDYLNLTIDNIDVAKLAFHNRMSLRHDLMSIMKVIENVPEKAYAFSSNRVKIGTVAGRDITMSAPFANILNRDVVSSASSTSRAVLGARRRTFTALNSTGTRQMNVQPSSKLWATAHAEHVRNVLWGDEIGQMFIKMSISKRDKSNAAVKKTIDEMKAAGQPRSVINAYLRGNYSDDEITKTVMKWLDSSESTRWKQEQMVTLGDYRSTVPGSSFADVVDVIRGDVNKFLPLRGPSGENYAHMRQALVDDNYDAVISSQIPDGFRTAVYGNVPQTSLSPAVIWRNVVSNLFHMLATLPEDTFSRMPFYQYVYIAEGERLANLYAKQGRNVQDYITDIENSAHAAAREAVMTRLYSIERHTNIGHALRWLSPFYMASQNATKYWIGTALRNPDVAMHVVQAYTLPYRLGVVKNRDEDYLGVQGVHNPWNVRGHVMVFDYPKWMQNKFFDGQNTAKLEIPISGFDVAFQGQLPGVPQISSPIGSVFLGQIIRNMVGKPYDPSKFTEKYFGKSLSEMIQYLQPYYSATRGTTSGPLSVVNDVTASFGQTSVATEKAMIAIGGTMGSFYDVNSGKQFANRVDVIMADKLTQLAMNDVPITGALMDSIREEAISLAIKSFWAEALYAESPLVTTGRYRTKTEIEIKPELRRLQNQYGYDKGSAMFADMMDTRYGSFIAKLLTDSNTDNRFNFNSTEQTLSNIYQNENLISQVDRMSGIDKSFIGMFINQGDWTGDYSAVASDVMYGLKINGKSVKYSAEDRFTSQQDVQIRTAWSEYYRGIEQIENDARSRGVKQGTNAYDAYYGVWKDNWTKAMEEKYPLWTAAQRNMRMNRVELNLAAASIFVNNTAYMTNTGMSINEVQGIAIYLRERQNLIAELAVARKASGRETLDARDNQYVAAMRDDLVAEIDKQHPGFQRVFDIYFNGDKLNDISKYLAAYSYESN
jgi:hypothetical protein